MGRQKPVISKAELAVALNLSRGRVSQLIRGGLPTRPDGRVDRDVAITWYRDNIVPRLSNAAEFAPGGAKIKPAAAAVAAVATEPDSEDLRLYKVGYQNGVVLTAYRVRYRLMEDDVILQQGFDNTLAQQAVQVKLGFEVYEARQRLKVQFVDAGDASPGSRTGRNAR